MVLAALLTLFATAALRFGPSPSDAAVSSTLHGIVNDNFDIALSFDDGSSVSALPAGTYRVVINDTTSDHNFHLFGPGVNEDTGIGSEGTTTWNMTFRADSRYQFLCDVHADSMYGSFNVGAGDSVPQSSGSSGGGGGSSSSGSSGGGGTVISPGRNTTLATVDAGLAATGKPKLALNGKAVKSLAAGKYKLVVTDSSKKDAVTLQRTGARATTLTGVAFVGKKTVGVTLAAGRWKLFASTHPASAITFRVG